MNFVDDKALLQFPKVTPACTSGRAQTVLTVTLASTCLSQRAFKHTGALFHV